MPPIELGKLDSVLSAEPNLKSRGLVQVAPLDLQRLPTKGRQQLLDLFHDCEKAASWPWQFLAIAIGLIPKKVGDRGLGIMPWLVRLWSRLRADGLGEWVDATADPWDAAVAGSSALREGLRRVFF